MWCANVLFAGRKEKRMVVNAFSTGLESSLNTEKWIFSSSLLLTSSLTFQRNKHQNIDSILKLCALYCNCYIMSFFITFYVQQFLLFSTVYDSDLVSTIIKYFLTTSLKYHHIIQITRNKHNYFSSPLQKKKRDVLFQPTLSTQTVG